MDFDYDDKLIESLAEIIEESCNIVESLGLELQKDIGNDNTLYGYYVESHKKKT